MTRCEEFSRGEYAPRLLAYFLFLKSLLHEITHSGEPVKSIPEIPKIKKLKRRLFLRRLDSFFLSIRRGIEFSKVPVSVNGSRTKTTSTLGSSAKSPGYEESRFSHRGICVEEKKRIFHHIFARANERSFCAEGNLFILSLHSSFSNPCNDSLKHESIDLFFISYFYLSWNMNVYLLSDC